MDGNRRSFIKKLSNPQFKKKGGNRKGKWHNSGHEQSSGTSEVSETVYRILCHTRKIGSVIGKGGNIVKALREKTQAKITVSDSVPGSDERVIMIYSPSKQIPREQDDDENDEDLVSDKEDDLMELHCAAQDALLKVHDRIVEEDLIGVQNDNDNEVVVTTRLLVSNNMVGCILGKKGDVIQRLRSEIGANIRVLPSDHLPTCAMSSDELVQISGKPALVKKALYEVSTLLHQNPRKDKPLSDRMPHGGQGFHPLGPPMMNMHPIRNPMWSQRSSDSHGMPPMSWMGRYGNQASGFEPGGFNDVSAPNDGAIPNEFSMKILCSAAKIGGVIGKGGANVRQLQQETGASIHVDDISADSEERVIRVSSFETLRNARSQTIDAILLLQNKASEFSEKGITTRLLVPSSKVGCILGQGGQVINEMRRRTQADIRVFSKEDKPKCAAEDEELVQISGNLAVVKDALAEIASRLRARCLRDANSGAESTPSRQIPGFGPAERFPVGRPHSSGSSGGYEFLKVVGHEYEPPSFPVPTSAAGFPNVNSPVELKIPNSAASRFTGTGESNISQIAGTRARFPDPQSGVSDYLNSGHGSSIQAYGGPSGQIHNPPHSSYQSYSAYQGAYPPNIDAPQTVYQNINPRQTFYQNSHAEQATYHNISTQSSYQ